jgi:hypothetical protein
MYLSARQVPTKSEEASVWYGILDTLSTKLTGLAYPRHRQQASNKT